MAVAVLTDMNEVASALADWRLTEEILSNVIRRGEQGRNAATQHHPRNAGGWYAYSEGTTALRDAVVPLGGESVCIDGHERCVCPGGGHEIAVLGGDRFTGDPIREPQPRYVKPRKVAQGTIARSQVPLFKQEDIATPPARRRLWFLMVRREGDNAIAELSRPAGITDSGRITAWETRIILRPVPVSSVVMTDKDTEQTPPVDIDVSTID